MKIQFIKTKILKFFSRDIKHNHLKAPVLEEKRCSVLIAEYSTGQIFKKDLTLYLKSDNEEDTYQLFETLNEAEIFVENLVKSKQEFECIIYDHNGDYLKTSDIMNKKIADNYSDPY